MSVGVRGEVFFHSAQLDHSTNKVVFTDHTSDRQTDRGRIIMVLAVTQNVLDISQRTKINSLLSYPAF